MDVLDLPQAARPLHPDISSSCRILGGALWYGSEPREFLPIAMWRLKAAAEVPCSAAPGGPLRDPSSFWPISTSEAATFSMSSARSSSISARHWAMRCSSESSEAVCAFSNRVRDSARGVNR
jgi:hypothetical protein